MKERRGKTGMKIEKFVTGIISTNCYLVINEETKQTVIIDPAASPAYLMNHLKSEGLKVEAIFLTHGHFDHMMGLDGFLKEYDVPVYVEEEDEEVLQDPRLNLSATYTEGYVFTKAETVQDGEILSFAGYEFRVIHTPGHTKGGCCYYEEKEKALFSGDTIFMESIGRTDLPTGNTAQLLDSVRNKVLVLPDDVKIYPGHGPETTVAYEAANNPYA